MSILAHDFEVHTEDWSGLAAPEGIIFMRHSTFDDRYWFFAAFEVERPRICREVLYVFAVDSSAANFDVFALGATFDFRGFLGRSLCGSLLGGSLFGYLGVFDGGGLLGPHCGLRGRAESREVGELSS